MRELSVIRQIFWRDLKKILRNPIALLVTLGVVLLPSMYAWFNIQACWDPYSNTRGIAVAVACEDQGVVLNGTQVNAGKKVMDNLKDNQKMGWTFVSRSQAVEGTKAGRYYAAIVIPPDFSAKLTSMILAGELEWPEIDYYVNEKKNSIAPKITEKGVSAIQLQVNESFIQLTTEVIFEILHAAGAPLNEDSADPVHQLITALYAADASLDEVDAAVAAFGSLALALEDVNNSLLAQLPDGVRSLQDGQHSVADVRGLFDSSRLAAYGINRSLADLLNINRSLAGSLESSLDRTFAVLADDLAATDEPLREAQQLGQGMIDLNTRLIAMLSGFNQRLPVPLAGIETVTRQLTKANQLQRTIRETIVTLRDSDALTKEQLQTLRQKTRAELGQLQILAAAADDAFNYQLAPAIDAATDDTYAALRDVSFLLQDLEGFSLKINNTFASVGQALVHTSQSLQDTQRLIQLTHGRIQGITQELDDVTQSQQWKSLIKLLRLDPMQAGDFMASPVRIKYHAMYPVKNYGSAMTPFYTVLCLWVGGLVLVAIFKCRLRPEKDEKALSPNQAYFARYALFLLLGGLQALTVTVGNLLLLRVQCDAPVLFILTGVVVSGVFTLIIYTLTLSFGDVGKAIAVVLLVLQVAGSGGTFPVEMTPAFFQSVHPLLPFTHGINAMRECVAGVYWPDYWTDMGKLIIFTIPALILGIYLRRPLIWLNEFFEKKLEETGLM